MSLKKIQSSSGDYLLQRSLGMAPSYVFENFIPNVLDEMTQIRADQVMRNSLLKDLKLKVDSALEGYDGIVNNKGFMSEQSRYFKRSMGLNNYLSNSSSVDRLVSEVDKMEDANYYFYQKTKEIFDLLTTTLGLLKLRRLIRYTIKLSNGKYGSVNLYRWTKLEDVNKYNLPRWHYNFDFEQGCVYIRRDDGVVVFNGQLSDFVAKLSIGRF